MDAGSDDDLHLSLRVCLRQFLRRGLGQSTHINGRANQLLAGNARGIQEVVNPLRHALADDDAPQIGLSRLIDLLAIILQHNLAETGDAAQRRARVMGDGVAESLQFAVRGQQVGVGRGKFRRAQPGREREAALTGAPR